MRLPIRHYRCYPLEGEEYDEANFGYASREIDLDPRATAFIMIDLWNMGWEAEPLVPELSRDAEYSFLGLGRRACAEARRVTEENLAPALRAARRSGMTVIHSNCPQVVARYPECAYEARESTPAGTVPSWPPAEVGEAVMQEYFRHTFGENAPAIWARMVEVVDFPEPVRPQPGDLCVHEQAAVDEILRDRRITTVIHAGFLLAHCLLDRPGGIRHTAPQWRRPGYRDILLRDCTVAQESRESIEGFGTTKAFLFWLEATGVPTAAAADFVRACG